MLSDFYYFWVGMEYEIKTEKKFRYIDVGEGHPIVILHGLFGSMSNFTDVIDHFSKTNRVILPFLPLFELPILTTNISNLSKYITKFFKFKNLSNFTLVGNSLGGHIGLVYTAKNPKNVHSLVLAGSSGLYENAFGSSYPKKGDKVFLKEKISVTFFDPKFATDELVEEVYDTVNNRFKLIRILSLAKSAIRHNMEKELPKITTPTCLIWGKNDNITPPDVAKEFEKLMPNSELHWIDKCGHAPMMEHPEEFNQYLDEFLKKVV